MSPILGEAVLGTLGFRTIDNYAVIVAVPTIILFVGQSPKYSSNFGFERRPPTRDK
jgi:hypothetical protein